MRSYARESKIFRSYYHAVMTAQEKYLSAIVSFMNILFNLRNLSCMMNCFISADVMGKFRRYVEIPHSRVLLSKK